MTCRTGLYITLTLSMLSLKGYGQGLLADLSFDGLFDNREYKNDMLPQTIYGVRVMPEVGIEYGQSTLIAGFSKIFEFGADDNISPNVILYYKYQGQKWNVLFGNIPRSNLQRQLPDALLYDSIAFFEPAISGTVIQRHGEYWQTELYCNWFSRQTETNREAFRIVWDGYAAYTNNDDLNDDFFHAGWFVTMTHWAKPKKEGYFIYDNFQFNPYIGFDLTGLIHPEFKLEMNAGLLFSMVRSRKDEEWHKPIGFLGDMQLGWRMFDIKNTIYYGDCQQPFLYDPEAGLAFHRSDPFYNHTQYMKTEFNVELINNRNVLFGFSWNIHMTPDSPIHNQQLITVKYKLGMRKQFNNQR